MDAFYAAIEVLDNQSLNGKPVIVGGAKSRGVVSSASYEARTFGIHAAQPVARAMRLCPSGTFLPVRMERYQEVSKEVFRIFRRFTPLMEPISLDEAFLDVTDSTRLFGSPVDIASRIKKIVAEETGLTVSAGVAPSKFLAKIASDIHKPDGLTVVPVDAVTAFLAPLPIEKLWGVGKTTQKSLDALGIRTVGELSRLPVEVLSKQFGQHGRQLFLLARGIDDRDVEPARRAKSIGHERTFFQDILDVTALRKELLSLATKVSQRLRRKGVVGLRVTLKVKYHDFVQITRSVSRGEATDDGREIFKGCCRLLAKTEAGRRPVRLLGLSISDLSLRDDHAQLNLFEKKPNSGKSKKLNLALDRIHAKFGEEALIPGTLLKE
jgi:DNA polymerase-4